MTRTVYTGVHFRRIAFALLISNSVSLVLLAVRALTTQNIRYDFLVLNLFLALLPLVFACWLKYRLTYSRWFSLANMLLTILWVGFLPNSFYLISDLIHLSNTGEVSKLFDATLFFSFIFNGYVSGFLSVYLLHTELIKRRGRLVGHSLIALILMLSGFAVYLGRYLRWNTWDVLVNPVGILFDVSERIINPVTYPQSLSTTATFFILLASTYAVVWQLAQAVQPPPKR